MNTASKIITIIAVISLSACASLGLKGRGGTSSTKHELRDEREVERPSLTPLDQARSDRYEANHGGE